MKDFSVKKAILCGLLFLISLFTLLSLAFQLVNISLSGASMGESGFSLFDMGSLFLGYTPVIISFAIVCYIILIISIVMFILTILAFFKAPAEKYRKTGRSVIILGIVFCSLYLIMGIASVIVSQSYMGSSGQYYTFMTYAFVPLLMVIIFAIAYKVCNIKIPESLGAKYDVNRNADGTTFNTSDIASKTNKSNCTELQIIEITREEFEIKKGEFLKLTKEKSEEKTVQKVEPEESSV